MSWKFEFRICFEFLSHTECSTRGGYSYSEIIPNANIQLPDIRNQIICCPDNPYY